MQSMVGTPYSYAVFTFQVDEAGAVSVPIGVALWSPKAQWVRTRLVQGGERLRQLSPTDHLPFVRLVEEQVHLWLETGLLPYCEPANAPYEDAWWRNVRDLLIHRIRLSEPRPIDCCHPDVELEPLYESVVSPYRGRQEQRARIEGEIRRCLGRPLAEKLRPRQMLSGFRDRPVKVLRLYRGTVGNVVVEGVNLATEKAELETDATVSRLLRVLEGEQSHPELIVGYLASPQGLNGEAVLVEWIRHQTGAHVFDLVRERTDFSEAARALIDRADGQTQLV